MTQSDNPYVFHTYSRLPQFTNTNDLSEATVIDEVAKLETAWSQSIDAEDAITYDESSIAFRNKLADNNSVLVLVEESGTGRMVGFGELINDEEKGPLFTLGYVIPERRRRGIADGIVKSIDKAGVRAGYDEIKVEPTADFRRVLINNLYIDVGRGPNEVILKKNLRNGTGEGPASPPGLPPQARK
jgi:hypothetical protein